MSEQLANEVSMRNLSPNSERRAQRSAWPSEALTLQLQRVAQRHELEVIVLADRGGNLWAASTRDAGAEALAAALPRLHLEPAEDGASRPARGGRELRVKALRVGAAQLYLAAQGPCCARGLSEVAPGVERILTALI